MLKKIAIAFGIVFIVVGLVGFVSAVTPDGKLLGYFEVNAAHNVVHIATGIVAVIVGFVCRLASPSIPAARGPSPAARVTAASVGFVLLAVVDLQRREELIFATSQLKRDRCALFELRQELVDLRGGLRLGRLAALND